MLSSKKNQGNRVKTLLSESDKNNCRVKSENSRREEMFDDIIPSGGVSKMRK
jgi:hypothetical protein